MITYLLHKSRPWPTKFPLIKDCGSHWEIDITEATEVEVERFAYWAKKHEEIEKGSFHKVDLK